MRMITEHRIGTGEPVDGLRGVAVIAILFAAWAPLTVWSGSPTARALDLGADLFLIISGYVVARAHREPLAEGRRCVATAGRNFLISRITRLFPVHLAVMAGFGAAVAFSGAPPPGGMNQAESASSFLQTALLLEIATGHGQMWFYATWLISAEFVFSCGFAVYCLTGAVVRPGWRSLLIGVVTGLAALRLSAPHLLDGPLDLAARGFVAFYGGVMLHNFTASLDAAKRLRRLKRRGDALIEGLALGCAILILTAMPAGWHATAPFSLLLCILFFLKKKGAVAKVLIRGAPARVGTLAYPLVLGGGALAAVGAEIAGFMPAEVRAPAMTFATPLFLFTAYFLAEFLQLCVDRPSYRAIRDLLRNAPTATKAPAA